MEKLAVNLDSYLATLVAPQDRSFTTFEDIEISDDSFSNEIMCTSDDDLSLAKRVGKNVLNLDGTTMTFSPAEVRVLNTLLINRETPLLSTHIQEIIGKSKRLTCKAISQLTHKLLDNTGKPLIEVHGVPRPNSKQQDSAYRLKKIFNIKEENCNTPEPLTRAKPLQDILTAYSEAERLHKKIDVHNYQKLFSYSTLPAAIGSRKLYPALNASEFYELFRIIDTATSTYAVTSDPWESAVQEGILAWHKVYYAGLGLVRYEVHSYEERAQFYGQTQDLRQVGAIALWNSILQYDPTKASFAYYARQNIAGSISHTALSTLRHIKHRPTSALHDKNADSTMDIRIFDEEALEDILPAYDNTEEVPMRLLHDSLAGHIINHPVLKPSEKLVLSLHYGIYCQELDGVVLDTENDFTLVYNTNLARNPFFRDGVPLVTIATIIGLSDRQTRRILHMALTKSKDIALTKVYTDLDYESYRNKTSIVFQP